MMTRICAHYDERRRISSGSCESAHVANDVTRCVEKVKGSVAKKVESIEATNLETRVVGVVKRNLAHVASLDIAFEYSCFGI